MWAFGPFFETFAFMICPLAALLFIVRLVVAAFSPKVSEQMRKHPIIHAIWGCLAFVGVLTFLGVLTPTMWPPLSFERQEQRQKVLERVQKAGGWEAVRLGCEALVSDHPDGLCWQPPWSNAVFYPNPQTEPHRYYFTNLDYGPLPSAVAALQPRQIYYYPPNLLPKNGPQFAVVQIKVFGLHSTGGHSIPYFGLEVACGTNAESYRPQPAYGGVSRNHYDRYEQVADRIYEIY